MDLICYLLKKSGWSGHETQQNYSDDKVEKTTVENTYSQCHMILDFYLSVYFYKLKNPIKHVMKIIIKNSKLFYLPIKN